MMKTGQTAAQPNQTSPVIAHKIVRPTAAMAGSFARKFPEQNKAGQAVAGEANQVKITHGKEADGKITWKGSESGYTTMKAPAHIAANVGGNTMDSGMHPKQKVK